MSEKIKLTISPAVAEYVRPGTPLERRLYASSIAGDLPIQDHLMLLFCLSKDSDLSVRSVALSSLNNLPTDIILGYLNSDLAHPLILNALPTICHNYPDIAVSERIETCATQSAEDLPTTLHDEPEQEEEPEDDAPVNEEEEEFLSKYKTAQIMGIGEKIKMALSGDKEWRAILVKDANKLVSGSVIKNPRITEGEVHTLIKSGIQNDEIMRLICANKEWIKSYKIRKALVENNRTPVQNAMRYLGTMTEKDLASFAKSKNIASVISTMAKRLLLNKKK